MTFEMELGEMLGYDRLGWKVEFVDLRDADMQPICKWTRPEKTWGTRKEALQQMVSGLGQEYIAWKEAYPELAFDFEAEGANVIVLKVGGQVVCHGQIVEIWG